MKPHNISPARLIGYFFTVLHLLSLASVQASALPLFGPETFSRETGPPVTASRSFQACNTGATYRLVVENGAAGKDRSSSGKVSLNGVEIIRPNDLNQRVERVEKVVSLQGDNTLEVRLTSSPGSFITLSLFCVSSCLDVSITSPIPDSTVNQARALVQGRLMNASGETGVVLTSTGAVGEASELAQVQGSLFAGLIPLQTGENTIVATATDACGYQVREKVTLYTEATQENVRLSTWPDSGVLPTGAADMEVALETNASLPSPAALYAWDFDGDGIMEQTGSDLDEAVAHYSAPGLYLPVVTVTDTRGNIYRDTAVVLVHSQAEMDTLLQGKWADMRNNLVNGDINAALKNFEGGQESKYKSAFEKLKGKFSEIFTADEQLNFVSSFGNRVEYENLVIEADKAYSYPVIFTKDENGLWKILQF